MNLHLDLTRSTRQDMPESMRKPLATSDKLRAKLGLTQGNFARLIGVAAPTVSRWENNRYEVSPELTTRLMLLARALVSSKPTKIINVLMDVSDPVERTIALVHLGD